MHVFGAQTILLSTGDCEILIPLAIHLWHPEKSECNDCIHLTVSLILYNKFKHIAKIEHGLEY